MADVWANYMACHPRATCHIAGCCHLANSMSWSQSYVSHCRVLPPGDSTACHPRATYHIAGWCHLVNSLSWIQSHMPHCNVCNNSTRHTENHCLPNIFGVLKCSLGFYEQQLLYRVRYICYTIHLSIFKIHMVYFRHIAQAMVHRLGPYQTLAQSFMCQTQLSSC